MFDVSFFLISLALEEYHEGMRRLVLVYKEGMIPVADTLASVIFLCMTKFTCTFLQIQHWINSEFGVIKEYS